MIKRIAMLMFIITLPLLAFADEPEPQSDLELFAFITTVENVTYLNVRITNRGFRELTVPTGKPVLSSTTFPNILIRYDILTMGPKEAPDKWKFIPSLVDLASVTLRKGETATLTNKLIGDAWSDPDDLKKHLINIEYMVSERVAKRFSFWQDTLKTKDSLKNLRKG